MVSDKIFFKFFLSKSIDNKVTYSRMGSILTLGHISWPGFIYMKKNMYIFIYRGAVERKRSKCIHVQVKKLLTETFFALTPRYMAREVIITSNIVKQYSIKQHDTK